MHPWIKQILHISKYFLKTTLFDIDRVIWWVCQDETLCNTENVFSIKLVSMNQSVLLKHWNVSHPGLFSTAGRPQSQELRLAHGVLIINFLFAILPTIFRWKPSIFILLIFYAKTVKLSFLEIQEWGLFYFVFKMFQNGMSTKARKLQKQISFNVIR